MHSCTPLAVRAAIISTLFVINSLKGLRLMVRFRFPQVAPKPQTCKLRLMPTPNLRIVSRGPSDTTAVCDACNTQFKSGASIPLLADNELRAMFKAHKCEPSDASQKAVLVKAATNDF